jgi:hypothetical protein
MNYGLKSDLFLNRINLLEIDVFSEREELTFGIFFTKISVSERLKLPA